ncbi:MAG: DUF3365 domain-containing protein [Nitrospirae bacterium]|nr:DUF3365 domain-containing protein [Nitrospirota bacterium]
MLQRIHPERGWRVETKLLVFTLPLIVAVTGLAAWVVQTRSTANLQENLTHLARSLHTQITADQQYYASVIVPRLIEFGGSMGPDYKQVHGQFPLPETFVREVAELTAAVGRDYTVNLISPWAINPDKGVKDPFYQDAFAYLMKIPTGQFFRADTIEGRAVMRVLMADLASAQSCVDCHNAHPKSPKHDFKLNDLMGGLEIVIPMDQYRNESRRNLVLTVAGGTGLCLLVIGIVVLGTRRTVTRPLAKLAERMRAFAEREKPADAVPSGYEVARLEEIFETMKETVAYKENELRDANARLEQQVMERTRILQGQTDVLGMVAQGRPLPEILDTLARLIEQWSDQSLCSILLLDADGTHLRHGAAPSLPASYNQAVDGIAIGPTAGSCGTAVYRREPVIVSDIASDPLWADYRDLALRHGLRACWSTLILSTSGDVLGTFAIYYREPRQPAPHHLHLIAHGTHIAGIAIERKRAEEALRQSEKQLRQAQKMDSVGRLAGGIAHDFNNLLMVVSGYSQIILGRLGADDPLRGEVEEIAKAGDRAAALTRQLLAFSRKQVLMPKVLDLNAVVTNMEPLLRRLIGENITVRIAPNPRLGHVRADPGQIEQVMMNLVVNARDAMLQGGRLTIETTNVELDDAFAHAHIGSQPGLYVMLAVSDTGCGMDAETQAHLFEPFFTTKEKGKGTGLGLSTVYGIIKQSGGCIFVYSEPGKGTTFKVYLPRAEEAPDATGPSTSPASALRGSETILLVEDDEGVRKITAKILKTHGYTVLEAGRGEEAFRVSGRHDGPIRLMVTDVVMPGISGRELAERLRSSRPGMRVLFVSGYADDTVVRHGVREARMAFLQKPFTPSVLACKVREVLDAPGKQG